METTDSEITTMPRIGDDAPDFEAITTKGKIKLSEFAKDKWLVMFSHPADFTPVCTTEMSGFAKRKSEFDALHTELLGLSIDSVHAHLGWVQNVRKNTGVQFDFPIIADISYKSDTLNITGPAQLKVSKEDSETITVDITSSLSSEGSHTAEVTFDIDQGESFTAEFAIDIVKFEQLTPNTTFNSYAPDLSADGQLIVLTSNADLASTGKATSAKDVFVYNWRMWGMMELRDLLLEAGFSKTIGYWEGEDDDGGGDGDFFATDEAEQCEAWVTYIAALKQI